MSARDSSDPAGPGSRGAGGLGNGGVGGGFGGGANGGRGGMGTGAGRNGGYDNRTGLGTGTTMYGNTAFGRPGGMATGYATRDMASLARAGMGPMAGSYGNFRGLNGQQMFAGSPVQNMNFTGMNAGQAFGAAQVQQAALEAAARNSARHQVGGLLDGEKVLSIEDVPPEVPLGPSVVPQSYYRPYDYLNQPSVSAVPYDPYNTLSYDNPMWSKSYNQNPLGVTRSQKGPFQGVGPLSAGGKTDLDTSLKRSGGYY